MKPRLQHRWLQKGLSGTSRGSDLAYSRGFSLAELMVAVAIAGLLMVGVSAFFSQRFGQVLRLSQEGDQAQSQAVLTELLRRQLMAAEGVAESGEGWATLKLKEPKKGLNFTHLWHKEDRIQLKDFFLFHGLLGEKSGTDFDVPLPLGLAQLGGETYVISGSQNALYRCPSLESCEPLVSEGLENPIGIASDGNALYLSQAKSHRIVRLDKDTLQLTQISDAFELPSGLAYYEDSQARPHLFVADSGKNLIKRIDLQTLK